MAENSDVGIEYADRYTALGIPKPPPGLVCVGYCEGTGWIPVKADDDDERLRALWIEAEEADHADDGWHFVKCPDCDGTGVQGGPSDRNHYRGP